VLLLDETLAEWAANEVEEVIRAGAQAPPRAAVTIVIIEHTMQAMVRLVDRFVVLNDGAVLGRGAASGHSPEPGGDRRVPGKRWRVANA